MLSAISPSCISSWIFDVSFFFFEDDLSHPSPCRSLSRRSLVRFHSCVSHDAQGCPLGVRRVLLWMVHDRTQCTPSNIYIVDAPHCVCLLLILRPLFILLLRENLFLHSLWTVLPAISAWQLGSDIAESLRDLAETRVSMPTSKSNGRKAETEKAAVTL